MLRTGFSSDLILMLVIVVVCWGSALIPLVTCFILCSKKKFTPEKAGYLVINLCISVVLSLVVMVLCLTSAFHMPVAIPFVLADIVIFVLMIISLNKVKDKEVTGKSLVKPVLLTALVPMAAACLFTLVVAVINGSQFKSYRANVEPLLADFTAETLDGQTFSSDELKGHKLVLVNLWATTCGPCKEEMPALGEIAREYADKDVVIVGICTDADFSEETLEEAKELAKTADVDYVNLVPSEGNIATLCSFESLRPTTYFLDENGEICEIVSGGTDKDTWIETIENHL